ncbi:MAG: 50S ribosomal protein L3 [Candidatus Aenigmarchaeota archaeon]|nr:50S ribosomal protein L3 [Candidatus Aenigmarchaeota archaeon]
MASWHKPVAGSRAYWPRKRAKRIFDSYGSRVLRPKEAVPLAFAGYKAGMTQVSVIDAVKGSATHGKEVFFPATVLAVPNLIVAGVKVFRRTPYGLQDAGTAWAPSLSKHLARAFPLPKNPKADLPNDGLAEVRLLVHTKPIGKKRPDVFEVPLGGDLVAGLAYAKGKLGQEIPVTDVLKEGEYVDVKAVSTGKGYQGPVARFGIKVRSRKNKGKRRHVGSMGPVTPHRVLPHVIAQAGQMGFQTRTEYNKLILKIGNDGFTPAGGWVNFPPLEGSYLLVKGSVPGPRRRLIMLRKGLRSPGDLRLEVKQVIKASQQ